MQVLTRLDQLSPDELSRVRRTLLKRWAGAARAPILDIAFGVAEKNDALDEARGDAVCFYVRRKHLPRARGDRVPPQVEVRVKRQHRFAVVRLPTDVIAFRPSRTILRGRRLRHTQSDDIAQAGCIVAWRTRDQTPWQWGVLSVGHVFWSRPATPETEKQVRLSFGNNQELAGVLLARTRGRDGQRVDASVVQVVKSTLVRAGLLPGASDPKNKRVRSLEQLASDRGRSGLTLPGRQRIPFVVARYFPESRLFSELGPMEHVLDVSTAVPGAFEPGTSGSLWLIAQQGACLQVGGWDSPQAPLDQFRRGLGQALLSVLQWVRATLAEINQVPQDQLQLRLVKEL